MTEIVNDTWKMKATEALRNGCTINGDGPDFVEFPDMVQ